MQTTLFDRRGVALIVVILLLAIIVPITLELNRAMRTGVFEAAYMSEGIRLSYVAKSGFNVGQMALLAPKKGRFDALTEDWANPEIISAVSRTMFQDAAFRVIIEDEAGKISLNQFLKDGVVNPDIREMLVRLLSLPEFRLAPERVQEIVNSLKDWMDKDDDVTDSGAETLYYGSLDRPYVAKNGPVEHLEELLMIKGVTTELYYGTEETPGLHNYLTLYGTGKININTAPLLILRILFKDITPAMAAEMDAYRSAPGNDLSDPTWFRKLNSTRHVSVNKNWITTKSDRFRITSVGYRDQLAQGVTGVVERNPVKGIMKRIDWKEF